MDLKEFECSSFKHAEVFTKWKNNSWRELHKKDKWKGNGVTHVKQSISIIAFQPDFSSVFLVIPDDVYWNKSPGMSSRTILKLMSWLILLLEAISLTNYCYTYRDDKV